MKTVMVTGGAGFIGANFLNLFVPRYPQIRFINVDKLTYAGNLASLERVSDCSNYIFEHCDVADRAAVDAAFERHSPDTVAHFAAESHVDRSLVGPADFIQSNIVGTFNLLEACRRTWDEPHGKRFHHVSTDEVFGSLGDSGAFRETTPYDPSSPYSASKASSDHLVRAYHRSYGLPVTISNCSNNYGPRQFPEKLIPLMILNALDGKPLPVYGEGTNVRDWLYVDDHCEAIWRIIEAGRVGETYNVGGECEMTNIDVVRMICRLVADESGRDREKLAELISFVTDRPGHDFRYAMDISKIRGELDWAPRETFESGLRKTVRWYLDNSDWVAGIRSGEYRQWIEKNYGERGAQA